MQPIIIIVALLAGLICRRLNYPPMLGYLLAGFIAHELGYGSIDKIAPIADLGILLLLFTIGLKLNLKELAAAQVWGVALLHMLIAVALTAPVIMAAGLWLPALQLADTSSAWALAFALSFSSTVFAVKIFDERGESAALHAGIAIGILVVQDIFAVAYLVLTAEKPVDSSAALLLLLPLARPLLLYMMRYTGHGELLILFGVAAAVGAAELFEWFNLKGGLGALIAGLLLSGVEKSKELYNNLLNLKDLFLIGFFLQIGYHGLPSAQMLYVAIILAVLVFMRPVIYFFLLTLFKLRARTSFVTGISLFNYSEFGLIVAAIAVSNGLLSAEWLTTLALALSLSFFIAVPFNTNVHQLFAKNFQLLNRFERKSRLDKEVFANLGAAKVVILGMGRVGRGAYEYLYREYGEGVTGVDEKTKHAQSLLKQGIDCVAGDASDYEFWRQTNLAACEKIFVCLSNHKENMSIVNLARKIGYQHTLAVVSRFADQQAELEKNGCISFNLYAEAGHGFAEHVAEKLRKL